MGAYLDKAGLTHLWSKMRETFVDMTDPKINIDSSAASGTTDYQLKTALTNLGWWDDVTA